MSLLHPGYILHTRPFRDTSVIAEVLLKKQGRLSCIARGIRKNRSELAGLIQPFQPLWLELGGRNELKTLFKGEARDRSLRFSGTKLFSALYLNELLIRLLEREDEHLEIFELYEQTLQQLESSPANEIEMILRKFELKLLGALGFGLTLDQVASSTIAVEPDLYYLFRPGDGIYETLYSTQIPCYKGSVLLAIADEDFSNPEALACAKVLFRQAIQQITIYRPILSRTIFTRRQYDYS